MPSLLIAGCGFLGESVAGFFCTNGWKVVGLTASVESAKRLSNQPYTVLTANLFQAKALEEVRARHGTFDIVLHCASSRGGGSDVFRQVYVEGIMLLARTFPEARLIFTSSTSVYAQVSGEWVDETSVTEPNRETGRLLLDAESIVLNAGGCVLRLAGIYGPGRSVLMRKFLEGFAVLEEGGRRWINQIHRDDAANAIQTIVQSGSAGTVYNVVDNLPATQREVYGWIADFFNRPLPPEGPADLHRKRGWTSKRVRNARIRELGWTPLFPHYGAALPSLAASILSS